MCRHSTRHWEAPIQSFASASTSDRHSTGAKSCEHRSLAGDPTDQGHIARLAFLHFLRRPLAAHFPAFSIPYSPVATKMRLTPTSTLPDGVDIHAASPFRRFRGSRRSELG